MFNIEVMNKLIALSKSEPEDIEFIEDCLKAFEEYHKAVFEEQTYTTGLRTVRNSVRSASRLIRTGQPAITSLLFI